MYKHKLLCRFCRGNKCKRCSARAYLRCASPALQGVHSNWIMDDVLGMARPSDRMVDADDIKLLDQFQKHGITAIFNLTESGEHPWCGDGLLPNGFTYTPERFMAAGVKHFNFNWEDLTAPTVDVAISVVSVAMAELEAGGKVALHCHAGLGRTGLIAACIIMARMPMVGADAAVAMVREKRPGSVQTSWQQAFVHQFKEAWPAYCASSAVGSSSSSRRPEDTVGWDESRVAVSASAPAPASVSSPSADTLTRIGSVTQ